MNKVTRMAAAGVCLLMLCAAASAQSVKVGVLDNNRLQKEYAPLKAALDVLDATVAARKAALQQRQAELKAQLKTYQLQKDVYSADKRKEKQQEISEMESRLHDAMSSANEELMAEQKRVLKPFVARIQAVVEKVAKAQHYDVVLKRENVAYFNPTLDITGKVIAELNKKTASR